MEKVEILENWGRETELRKKWIRTWERLGARVLKFPRWMQVIVLQDVNTAIENRVATMEMILKATGKHARK